jgi:hypothetical protein
MTGKLVAIESSMIKMENLFPLAVIREKFRLGNSTLAGKQDSSIDSYQLNSGVL